MPTNLVEREIPGAGAWTPEQRKRVAETVHRIAEIHAVVDPASEG